MTPDASRARRGGRGAGGPRGPPRPRRPRGRRAVEQALGAMARRLVERADPVLAANARDVEAAARGPRGGPRSTGCGSTRPRLGRDGGADRERSPGCPTSSRVVGTRPLEGGLVVEERRRPVGVIGANYEARPNVTVDVASQLVKSRNAGVLRTGAAALGVGRRPARRASSRPALEAGGHRPRRGRSSCARPTARRPGRWCPSRGLIPLVILRGSGETTRGAGRRGRRATGSARSPTPTAAASSTSTRAADPARALALVERSLDRLGRLQPAQPAAGGAPPAGTSCCRPSWSG